MVFVPFGTAFWGASFTVSRFRHSMRIEWRNLGISNAVTTVVLVPAFLLGAHYLFAAAILPSLRRVGSGSRRCVYAVALGIFVFDGMPMVHRFPRSCMRRFCARWAALRWGNQRLMLISFPAIWGTMRGHGRSTEQSRRYARTTAVPPGDRHSADAAHGRHRRGKTSKEALREAQPVGLAAEAETWPWVWDVSGNDVDDRTGRSLLASRQMRPSSLRPRSIACTHRSRRA